MKLIGYMAVHNGAEFIDYAIRSTINSCNRFIVIEGAWGENIMANKQPRSTDGTLDILSKLQEDFPQLEVYHRNEKNQLVQRSCVFSYLKNEHDDVWLWLIDHDEVYDAFNIRKMMARLGDEISGEPRVDCLKINSYTFINDFWHKVEIAWPRLFRIRQNYHYVFYAPNNLLKNGEMMRVGTIEEYVSYFHYSYCHSPERFLEKRRERILLHGQFKWDLDDGGQVIAPGTNIVRFEGKHPDIMKDHPLYTENIDE